MSAPAAPAAPRAGIYCRLSKEDDDRTRESESIQNQREMLLGYARAQGYAVAGVWCDEDYSGADAGRPAFCAMLCAAQAREFDILLVKTQSRFTRDMELAERYLHHLFPEWGIRFIALVDHVDTADPGGKKSRQLNGLINEWYLEDLSDNVRSVLRHKRREGKYLAAFALYGYRKDPADKNHLLPDPPAAAVVREIFARSERGEGAGAIVRALNARGEPCPAARKRAQGLPARGGRNGWNRATVCQMLHNAAYAGDTVQGRRKKLSYKSGRILYLPPQEWDVVPDTHAPLVSRARFAAVQRRLAAAAHKGSRGAPHPLAGRVFCGACGARMALSGSGARGRSGTRTLYLRCSAHARDPALCRPNYIPLALLEKTAADRLQTQLDGLFSTELSKAFPRADAALAGRLAGRITVEPAGEDGVRCIRIDWLF